MDKKQVTKRAYLAPRIEVCPVRIKNPLLAGSVSGNHHDAEDDETLNAKPGFLDDGEDSWKKVGNLWDEE